jgi:hypothetical protein
MADAEILVDTGKSGYRIVLAKDAIPTERTAAEELQSFLEKSTGTKLPITERGSGPAIFIGQSDVALKALELKSWKELKPDEIRLKTVGTNLFLVGDRPRGTLYAVYEFLEQQAGVRFWTAAVTDVPSHRQLTLPQLDYRYAPPFQVRSAGYESIFANPKFAVQLRNNGHDCRVPAEWGGDVQVLGCVHTFSQNFPLLPVEEYFSKHPEWYAERNGKRVSNQLCLTNPDLRRELIRKVLERLRQNPNCRYISVSQNDNQNYCQCDACTAFVKKHGNQTDLLLDAVNQVASAVASEFPDVLIETLAYQYTRTPPMRICPADNVIIRYATIEQECFKPLQSPDNRNIYRDLMGWHKVAKQLMIWNYVTDFVKYYQPHPNWQNLASDLKLFRKFGAINIYEQGSWNGGGSIADLGDLRAWLVSKLLWNPDLDTDALINEFLQGYYGPTVSTVRVYIDLMNQAVNDHPKNHETCYAKSTAAWLDDRTLLKAWSIMADAKRKFSGDSIYGPRIAIAAVPITCALLERLELWEKDSARQVPELRQIKYSDLLKETEIAIKNAGVSRMYEGELTPEAWQEKLLRQYAMFFGQFPNDGAIPSVTAGEKYHAWAVKNISVLCGPVFVDKDPAATGGTAIRMPNVHNEWSVQGYDFPHGTFDLYMEVRCDSSSPQGNAIRIGIYDWSTKSETGKEFPAQEIAGKKYNIVKFGKVTLKDNICFFIAPIVNPRVKNIWIDRLILIPVKP